MAWSSTGSGTCLVRKDYTDVIAALDREVGEAVATYGTEGVGVYAVTLDEASAIMAATRQRRRTSPQVRGYVCDGNILLETLTTAGDAARFAA